MTLGELVGVLGHGKDTVKIIESDMTDESEEWTGYTPELADRVVKSVWAVNNRSDCLYDYGKFVVHVLPKGR